MLPRLAFWFSHLFVLGFTLVLAGGFAVQFAEAEMPCPLCILQRMAMMLCAIGGSFVVRKARDGAVTAGDLATGYGLAIVGGVAGAAMSGRQILLHILPDDPGYGDTVLGLHLYTWAFVTFAIAITTAAVNLVLAEDVAWSGFQVRWASTAVLWLLGAVIAANAVVVFVEEGFSWVLPDDPERYELLYDLGIKG